MEGAVASGAADVPCLQWPTDAKENALVAAVVASFLLHGSKKDDEKSEVARKTLEDIVRRNEREVGEPVEKVIYDEFSSFVHMHIDEFADTPNGTVRIQKAGCADLVAAINAIGWMRVGVSAETVTLYIAKRVENISNQEEFVEALKKAAARVSVGGLAFLPCQVTDVPQHPFVLSMMTMAMALLGFFVVYNFKCSGMGTRNSGMCVLCLQRCVAKKPEEIMPQPTGDIIGLTLGSVANCACGVFSMATESQSKRRRRATKAYESDDDYPEDGAVSSSSSSSAFSCSPDCSESEASSSEEEEEEEEEEYASESSDDEDDDDEEEEEEEEDDDDDEGESDVDDAVRKEAKKKKRESAPVAREA